MKESIPASISSSLLSAIVVTRGFALQRRRCMLRNKLQQLACLLPLLCPLLLLLLRPAACSCSTSAADGSNFALEAHCIGGPNEESGSVFSITSIVTVPTQLADA